MCNGVLEEELQPLLNLAETIDSCESEGTDEEDAE